MGIDGFPGNTYGILQTNITFGFYRTDMTHETHVWNATNVETRLIASLPGRAHQQSQKPQPPEKSPFTRKPKSISSFIAGFKSAVNSKFDDYIDDHQLDMPKFNRHNHFFQPNYYDRVIRNEREYMRIKNYIIDNPANWDDDNFNPLNNTCPWVK